MNNNREAWLESAVDKLRMEALSIELGAFPHSPLSPATVPKTQSTRMNKMECETCGYLARTARKWLDQFGPVKCPCNGLVMKIDLGLEGE